MATTVLTAIVFILLFQLALPYLPKSKTEAGRWSTRRVKTAGGLLFLPFWLPFAPAELLVAGVGVWALGLADDLHNVRPRHKLTVQSAAATFLLLCGWRLGWTSNLILDLALGFFWLVGLTNSLNMLDNMDGSATGIAAIAAATLYALDPSPVARQLAAVCLGFLAFNLPPARAYMGDCGAMFLGLNLAYLGGGLGPVVLLVLAVPLGDTLFVTVRRLLSGRSPMHGDRGHLAHELARGLGGEPLALAVLWACGLGSGALAMAL